MKGLTRQELLDLRESQLTAHLPTAARAYGKSRTWAYQAADRGEFPVPVLRLGGQRVVRTADLVADLLGGDL